jgi:hypothetical protein
LKQLLGNTEIESSVTFDQSITVIWAKRSLGLRLAFTDNHNSIVIHSIQSRIAKKHHRNNLSSGATVHWRDLNKEIKKFNRIEKKEKIAKKR